MGEKMELRMSWNIDYFLLHNDSFGFLVRIFVLFSLESTYVVEYRFSPFKYNTLTFVYSIKVLAIKKLDSTVMPFQSSDDFAELVSNISKLHHPNLNELVGYCMEHGQHLLVYDFHRNGSLHDLLHLSDEYSKPLSWNSRVKIALGSARALE